MHKINVIAMGSLKEPHFKSAAAEYKKRLSLYADIKELEIPEIPPKSDSKKHIDEALLKESTAILKRSEGTSLIACCVDGEPLNSLEFAGLIKQNMYEGKPISFIIGSSHGLHETALLKAKKISFSKMTLPHELFRVFLYEQIYRAMTIMSGSKYHK